MWSPVLSIFALTVVMTAGQEDDGTDCFEFSDSKCKNATSTATIHDKKFCCIPPNSTITVSTRNENGVVTETCRCRSEMAVVHVQHIPMPMPPVLDAAMAHLHAIANLHALLNQDRFK